MDLLDDYGSDEEDEDEDEDERVEERHDVDNNDAPKRLKVFPDINNKPDDEKKNGATAVSQKGRKLVSIASLLPSHILEALQKGSGRAGADDDDDDDDDDDEDSNRDDDERTDGLSNKTLKEQNQSQQEQKRRYASDVGLSSFLSDLEAARPVTDAAKHKKINQPNNDKHVESQPMGLSFMQTKTEVVRTTTKKSVEGTQRAPTVETVGFEDEAGQDVVVTAPDKPHIGKASTIGATSQSDLAASKSKRSRFSHVPRPAIRSLPSVSNPTSQQQTNYAYSTRETLSLSSTQQEPSQQRNVSTIVKGSEKGARQQQQQGNKKRSRQQMEKALREGKLDEALTGATSVHYLKGTKLTEEYSHASEAAIASTVAHQHGIRVAPVAMYDTSQGKDVVGITGKARGKNQINHLMASAAAFEANNAAAAATNSVQKMRSYRASAKQKYGW